MDQQPDKAQTVNNEKRLEQLREAVNAQILRAQNAAAERRQSLLKESFGSSGDSVRDRSPSFSPPSDSPRSTNSSQRLDGSVISTVHPNDYPFPAMESGSSSVDTGVRSFGRAGSTQSDITARFRPSLTETIPNSRQSTYNSWSHQRDFPSPNLYDLTLKMNADYGMEPFWENIIDIFVTEFYASRVVLSIPYDLTDISNTPWGLKATYDSSVDRQQKRIKLERRQSQEPPGSMSNNQTDSDTPMPTSENITPRQEVPKTTIKTEKKRKSKPVSTESVKQQLDTMLQTANKGKVYSNLVSLDSEKEVLIDDVGVQRVLERGSIVVLSREYHDLTEMRKREEETLKVQAEELNLQIDSDKNSVRSEVLTAWEQTYFKPPAHHTPRYDEHEQSFVSPWSQSPAPSPAILKDSSNNPFFESQSVESAFSPDNEQPEYEPTEAVYAIGMESCRCIVHIPLVHPQTSKSISSDADSSGSSGHPRIVPIAIISFLSAVTPYPAHLIASLATFAPLIATSLSLAIRHSNVVHQLTYSPSASPRPFRQRRDENSPTSQGAQQKWPPISSPLANSSATNSNLSTPSWDIQGHLFSPAVTQAETPSPFRSTLNVEGGDDYFSPHRGYGALRNIPPMRTLSTHYRDERKEWSTDDVRPDSSESESSLETAPTEQSSDRQSTPVKVRRRGRRATRAMIHSFGATTQFPGGRTPKKGKRHQNESTSTGSDPYQMPNPSSRLLKVVVDSIPVHVFTASPGTGTITWANARTLAYRGITAEEYIANPHGSLHPDDSLEFMTRWERMLQHETDGMSQSVRVKRFDGQYRWFAARVVPLRDSRGGVVHWFGTCMDIHDAREAEINNARQEEIKASELKYRSLAEASPQIVFAATPALGISYANSQWMSYSGVPYEETAKLGFLSFVHPDDRARCALPTNGDPHPQFSVEIRLQGADKAYRWHLVKCIRIESHEGGKDDIWLGTCTDIDDHKQLEQRLKLSHEAARAAEAEHKKRAEDALETRRQQEFFIDMVSHELRNPLSAIVQSSDVVQHSLTGLLAQDAATKISHEISDDIDTMRSIGLCTMHMRRLIDDTINVSKLESGMLQVTPVDCQPMTIVRQIQQIFDAELQSKKIEMEILRDDTYNALQVQWVRADPSRISQILINLLSNSIKFLDERPERRIVLTLGASTTPPDIDSTTLNNPEPDVTSTSEDLYLSFSIMDTGPGLKRAEMAALFQRFSQATPRTHVTYGGSGLGLFISKRLVELQGGHIYVDSVEGQGSTFAFFIKVGRSTRVDAQGDSPTFTFRGKLQDVAQNTGGNQIHVLVVEDNLINQRLLKKQLVGSGYEVSVANHGQEAIDKILSSQNDPKERIDIVLMDVEMPILDGLQATKLLREAEAKGELRKHIPVIAVSANAREEQKKKMFDAGANSYLTKPFQMPELVLKLKEHSG